MNLKEHKPSRFGEIFLKRNPTTNFVATDNGKIVGTILCGHDGRRGYIYHTVVKDRYRNQGIATSLVRYAMELARSSSCKALRLDTRNQI